MTSAQLETSPSRGLCCRMMILQSVHGICHSTAEKAVLKPAKYNLICLRIKSVVFGFKPNHEAIKRFWRALEAEEKFINCTTPEMSRIVRFCLITQGRIYRRVFRFCCPWMCCTSGTGHFGPLFEALCEDRIQLGSISTVGILSACLKLCKAANALHSY
ncbi:hypothetical protein BaRGS_00000616 [Batillaria attramentaria]|uniref:Uncharacterized protein n=1 Tax=Batillaria attramentaria TaxID=370345 RepID=A0ABD0MAH9_9CAEN